MANGLYDNGRALALGAGISWNGNAIKVVLVDTAAYTVNLATHTSLADIPAGARIATSGALAGKTTTAGVADANDPTISAVSGASIEALVIYIDSGVEATSYLICYIDTATGLPFTPSGGDVQIVWDNGANKIFKL